ncbi:MAG: hypothetical protein AAF525_02345 [Pseudomonadota bacterium]
MLNGFFGAPQIALHSDEGASGSLTADGGDMIRIGKRLTTAAIGLMISSLVLADEYWVIASFQDEKNAEQSRQQWSQNLGPDVVVLSKQKSSGEPLHRVVILKSMSSKSELEMAGISPWTMKWVPEAYEEPMAVPASPLRSGVDAVPTSRSTISATTEPRVSTRPVPARTISTVPDSLDTSLVTDDAEPGGTDWQRKLLEDYCDDVPEDDSRLQDMCAVWLSGPAGKEGTD